jgi:hypothetical protein
VASKSKSTFYSGLRGETILFASVRASASGQTTVVSAVANKKIKMLSYVLVTDDVVTANWQSNSTDLTGAMSFSANGGIASPVGTPGGGWLFETAVNEDLNLNLGSSVGVSGHISYFLEG